MHISPLPFTFLHHMEARLLYSHLLLGSHKPLDFSAIVHKKISLLLLDHITPCCWNKHGKVKARAVLDHITPRIRRGYQDSSLRRSTDLAPLRNHSLHLMKLEKVHTSCVTAAAGTRFHRYSSQERKVRPTSASLTSHFFIKSMPDLIGGYAFNPKSNWWSGLGPPPFLGWLKEVARNFSLTTGIQEIMKIVKKEKTAVHRCFTTKMRYTAYG